MQAGGNASASEEDKEPVFAKVPSESEIVMRDTSNGTASV